MSKILLFLFIGFISYCSSIVPKKKVEFDFEKPNIRIDNYPETFNLKAKGPVLCGFKECTEADTKDIDPDKIKTLTKHGIWEEYDEKTPVGDQEKYSVLGKKGRYEKGKRDGEWNFFYDVGQGNVGPILRTTNYKLGSKEGLEKKFSKEGLQTEETTYLKDLKDGPYWNKNNKGWMEEEGPYLKDKRDGQWTFYYAEEKDGQVKSITNFKNDEKDGKETRFHPNGSKKAEGNYITGLETGNWIYYYDNGSPEYEGMYDPQLSKVVDEEDKDRPSAERPKAKKVGVWKRYYKNGKVFSQGERDGKMKGEWLFYYPNGKLAAKGTMANDLMMSEGEIYGEDGLIEARGKFMISILKLDTKLDTIKISYKPSKPFIKFKNGKKYLEVSNASKEGAVQAYLYDESETKIGEGPIEPMTQKKNGCWVINGKKVYYLMDKPKTGTMAKMQKCE
ncbi:MAG: LIC20035 family adhesin [Leptospiraceae bacterium]|nr:LIC20035 family adhesin [Leptospiraceae bacterium]MCP5510905.1 LIC20035 family adhesin [Leptospiraceae bacterium]